MEWSDPELWRWIWLVAAVIFAIGEIASAGSFFLAPFAIGSAIAAGLAFAGVDVGWQWVAFVAISAASLLSLRPLARKLDAEGTQAIGVGAGRQVGQRGRVVEAIDGEHDHGFVMLGAARWRAEAVDGQPIAAGATVVVVEVRGTRLIVSPAEGPAPGPAPIDPAAADPGLAPD